MPGLLATAGSFGWNLDPVVLLNLALASYLYARGLERLWRAGAGRGVSRWQACAFAVGILAVGAALVSPLDPLSDELSSAHMVQHMVLMNVAAPLLVVGNPLLVVLSGVPAPYRLALGRAWQRVDVGGWTRNPYLAWAAYAAVLWAWHHPALYRAALRDPLIHDLEHLTFFAAACLFWRAALGRQLSPLAAVAYLFTTSLHATALGVFMALAPSPWYAEYLGRTDAHGLTALEDQQLAGLIMWMPACVAYVGVAAGRLIGWIAEQEHVE